MGRQTPGLFISYTVHQRDLYRIGMEDGDQDPRLDHRLLVRFFLPFFGAEASLVGEHGGVFTDTLMA